MNRKAGRLTRDMFLKMYRRAYRLSRKRLKKENPFHQMGHRGRESFMMKESIEHGTSDLKVWLTLYSNTNEGGRMEEKDRCPMTKPFRIAAVVTTFFPNSYAGVFHLVVTKQPFAAS